MLLREKGKQAKLLELIDKEYSCKTQLWLKNLGGHVSLSNWNFICLIDVPKNIIEEG